MKPVVILFAGIFCAAPALASDYGLFIKEGERRVAAPITKTNVTIAVTGIAARVTVAQSFSNPNGEWSEGVYVFPLPEKAAVDHLDMRVGERVIVGQIRERERAKRIYDAAKQEGRRASLVEQERANIFTTSVANIPPHGAIEVTIEYQQTLRYDAGEFRLRFPMVVATRYIPGNDIISGEPGTGWAFNTSAVPDAARITPPVVGTRAAPRLADPGAPVNPVLLTVALNPGFPLAKVSSTYHEAEVIEVAANRYRVRLDEVSASKDFELVWTPQAGAEPQAALLSETREGSHYALLMLIPPLAPQVSTLLREVIFVVDTSGSMHGTSIAQAKAALKLALKRLGSGDAFNVIQFNSITHQLFNEPRRVTADSVSAALRYVDALSANGGTEMFPALKAAFAQAHDESRVRQIVFLTDGAVGNEEQLFGLIREGLGASRLFTIGIGSAPNSFFMKKAAEFGKGTFTYIGKIEEVQARMNELFAKLERPALTDIKIVWPDGVEMWPTKIPDLYFGEPLMVTAALGQLEGVVKITGRSGGAQWQSELALSRDHSGSGIHVLWAREKIEALMNHERENPDGVRGQIIELALKHHLVSKHTSLVALDVTPVRAKDANLNSSAIAANLPEGWSCPYVFGHECETGELPQGASASDLHILLGMALLLMSALLSLRIRRRAHC
ncbi:MAG TPA: marine proteobacterial sortase target protein [Burkholderiales bacterium]|nr:marine proteobacterial sortase target protein [Burkholderiales bacterium]